MAVSSVDPPKDGKWQKQRLKIANQRFQQNKTNEENKGIEIEQPEEDEEENERDVQTAGFATELERR